MDVQVPTPDQSQAMDPPAHGRLFVYGTLRAGHAAHSLIADHVSSSERASMKGSLLAFEAGYPGLLDSGDNLIVGELLELDRVPAALMLLDAYEGSSFSRVQRKVRRSSGEEVWAWCYVVVDHELLSRGTLIEHGDWVRFRRDEA